MRLILCGVINKYKQVNELLQARKELYECKRKNMTKIPYFFTLFSSCGKQSAFNEGATWHI